MDSLSSTQFQDSGIPSANEPRGPLPMSLSASNMTGNPNDRELYQSFAIHKDMHTPPKPGATSTLTSSTYTAQ